MPDHTCHLDKSHLITDESQLSTSTSLLLVGFQPQLVVLRDGFNKKRAAERAQREEAKLLCAIALVGLLSPALAAEVSAGVVEVAVVPYHSKEDLRKRGYTVDGTVFADFDKFREDNNPYFIRPDLIFSTPTICVSVDTTDSGELDATLELVYWPGLEFDVKNHFNVLHLIRLISSPLPETQYRHKQGLLIHTFCSIPVLMNFLVSGSMFGWGFRRERLLRSMMKKYSTARSTRKGGAGAEKTANWETDMDSVATTHSHFFQKYFSFLYTPMLEIVDHYKVKCLKMMPGFPAMFVTNQYCSAAHFDIDFSWSLCFWYNMATPKMILKYRGRYVARQWEPKRDTQSSQSGRHFYSPSIRAAFKLDSPCSAIVFHGSRLCHGTTMYSSEQMVRHFSTPPSFHNISFTTNTPTEQGGCLQPDLPQVHALCMGWWLQTHGG